MSADGVAEVKTALQGRVGKGEGLDLVRRWQSSTGNASDQVRAVAQRVRVVEDEFLDYPAKQALAWLNRLEENLAFVARKLGANK